MQLMIKNKRRFFVSCICALLCIAMVTLIFAPAVTTYAAGDGEQVTGSYESWIADDRTGVSMELPEMPDVGGWDALDDAFQEMMAEFFASIGDWIGHELYTWGLSHFTIDSIILGRMATGTTDEGDSGYLNDFSVTQFGLEKNNFYGIAGSKLYVILRNIIYVFFAVYLAYIFFKQAWNSNASKAWQTLKEDLYSIVFMMIMIYLMPQIVQAFLYLKEQLVYLISSEFSRSNVCVSIALEYRELYEESGVAIDAILYTAMQFAPLTYAFNYISIALATTLLFGMLPVILLLSISNKSIFDSWVRQLFVNLSIPIIDFFLYMIPVFVYSWSSSGNAGTPTISGGVTRWIAFICMWLILPTRTFIVNMLTGGKGGSFAVSKGAGLIGAATMAMSAIASIGRKAGGNSDSAKSDSGKSDRSVDLSRAKSEEANAAAFNQEFSKLKNEHKDDSYENYKLSQTGTDESGEGTGKGNGSFKADTEDIGVSDGVSASEINGISGSNDDNISDYEAMSDFDSERAFNLRNIEDEQRDLDTTSEKISSAVSERDKLLEADRADDRVISMADADIKRNSAEISALESENRQYADLLQLNRPEDSAAVRDSIKDAFDANRMRINSLKQANEKSRADISQAKQNQRERADAISTANKKVDDLRVRETTQRTTLERKQQYEERLAKLQEVHGGKGTVYSSRADFDAARRADILKKSTLTYKNFDTGMNGQLCSAQERAEFLRERAQHTAMNTYSSNIMKGMKVGTAVAGGVFGASIGMMANAHKGGAEMLQGTVGGATLGASVGVAGSSAVGSVVDAGVSRGHKTLEKDSSRRRMERPEVVEAYSVLDAETGTNKPVTKQNSINKMVQGANRYNNDVVSVSIGKNNKRSKRDFTDS